MANRLLKEFAEIGLAKALQRLRKTSVEDDPHRVLVPAVKMDDAITELSEWLHVMTAGKSRLDTNVNVALMVCVLLTIDDENEAAFSKSPSLNWRSTWARVEARKLCQVWHYAHRKLVAKSIPRHVVLKALQAEFELKGSAKASPCASDTESCDMESVGHGYAGDDASDVGKEDLALSDFPDFPNLDFLGQEAEKADVDGEKLSSEEIENASHEMVSALESMGYTVIAPRSQPGQVEHQRSSVPARHGEYKAPGQCDVVNVMSSDDEAAPRPHVRLRGKCTTADSFTAIAEKCVTRGNGQIYKDGVYKFKEAKAMYQAKRRIAKAKRLSKMADATVSKRFGVSKDKATKKYKGKGRKNKNGKRTVKSKSSDTAKASEMNCVSTVKSKKSDCAKASTKSGKRIEKPDTATKQLPPTQSSKQRKLSGRKEVQSKVQAPTSEFLGAKTKEWSIGFAEDDCREPDTVCPTISIARAIFSQGYLQVLNTSLFEPHSLGEILNISLLDPIVLEMSEVPVDTLKTPLVVNTNLLNACVAQIRRHWHIKEFEERGKTLLAVLEGTAKIVCLTADRFGGKTMCRNLVRTFSDMYIQGYSKRQLHGFRDDIKESLDNQSAV